MKIKLPALHHQILIALIAGTIFGVIFNVDPNLINVTYKKDKEIRETEIRDWNKLTLVYSAAGKTDTITYGESERLRLLKDLKKLPKGSYIQLDVSGGNEDGRQIKNDLRIKDVQSVLKESTIATGIKWIGDIFIRLLNMIAIPLVLSSLIVGAASLGDIKKFARIGTKTLAFYIVTTAIAVIIGITLANVIQPGKQLDPQTEQNLLNAFSDEGKEKMQSDVQINMLDMLVNMIPKNPFSAIADGEMLQIVFFSIIVGMVLTMINKEKSDNVIKFFDAFSDLMIRAVELIMIIAPIGVFALIASTVSEFGFNILQTLFWYAFTVLLGLFLHTFGVYGFIAKLFTKTKVTDFFKGIRPAQSIAFSTSSSAATLPVNMESCQVNLGVSKSISSFVLPLGATVNMDGTALYQGVATIFIAQVFGVDLSLTQQISIVLLATLASIGTAPVPGVGIIMLIIILKSLGIPEIGIALILGIDRILDMCRTVTNVTGDAVVCLSVATSENEVNKPEIEVK